MAAGAAVVVLIGLTLMVRREGALRAAAAAPPPAEAAAETPPDLGSMSPRERFDRLYRRVLGAAETGDTATLTRFAPMAFSAYAQLDSVDADARYHAAVLQLHVLGDRTAALRLADTILANNPGHLFGYLIRGTSAQLAGDQAALQQARADFLKAWDREMKAGHPEYQDHRAMLDQFRQAALAP